MARLPLPDREALTDEAQRQRWDRLAARGPVLNVFRLFMLNPEVELNAFSLWRASGLDARKRELVILRCAFVKQSTYEWHQHVRIAVAAGISPTEINALRSWRDAAGFSDDERALLAYVDALAAQPRPEDDVFAAVARGRTPTELLGVTALVTTYFQLAQMMATFDLETEEPFVGWEVAAS